jgi:glycosyltransferase involved in cell wall biosynthesis
VRDAPDHPEAVVRGVLHVSPYIHPAAGGPPVAVERWAELAGAHGWRASVLSTPAFADDSGKSLLVAAEGRYELALVSSAADVVWGAGRRTLLGLLKSADLVHLHTMWSQLNAVVATACRRMHKPYIISPHGMLDPYSLGVKALRKRLYLKLVERRMLAGAASVLFTADDERDLAIDQVGYVPNPQVVGLGADAPDTPTDRLAEQFRSEHPDLADKKLLIFLGRLHPKKRPDAAIRAMTGIVARVPDAVLLVAGSGEPGYVAELETLVRRLDLGSRVRVLGHLMADAKWRALAASDLFVLASLQENFAIATAEALQLGKPVLITKTINIWRDVVDAGAGIALREDVLEEDLADKAVDLLSHPEKCHAMGSNARALAQRAYTWPASTQNVCALYDRVIAAHGVTGA